MVLLDSQRWENDMHTRIVRQNMNHLCVYAQIVRDHICLAGARSVEPLKERQYQRQGMLNLGVGVMYVISVIRAHAHVQNVKN